MLDNGWIGNYSYFRSCVNPDSEAVYDYDSGKHYTYKDLDERADKLAYYLKEEVKIKKNDRVAFISRNRVEMIDGYYATGKTASILVPYNYRLSREELAELINNETPKIIFYESAYCNIVSELKKSVSVEKWVLIDDPADDIQEEKKYSDIMKSNNVIRIWNPDSELEDIHLIIHTGGTTGLPKGGMLSHRSVIFNTMNEICTWAISYVDSAHILLPLFHTGGWNLLTLPILHAGGRIILNRQFDPALTLKIINDEKTTFVFGAATMFRLISGIPEFNQTDFSSVKWIMSGAAPTPLEIMRKYWDKGIRFVLGYGMTEAGPNNLTAPAEFMSEQEMKDKYASVGRPMYLAVPKIVDENGNELGPDEPGELIWCGPQIFSGYWNNPDETAKTLRNGWVYTGDIAQKDSDGYYYIVGRKKNMFISGGENVFPPEIESLLYKIDGVHEVAVIGVPDQKWGEVGKAVVSLEPEAELSKEVIIQHLKKGLASYKVPKYIAFVDDVPKNSVGKIVAAKIKELYGKPVDEDVRNAAN